ncbi:protochlorophyllide oxidoreductase [Amycolatopsis antarctica]|uniref:Protochlorophyllide oxidoreductase n=1 Tax=Amycolatopsis antarctica TaxID=1854586 RepID=A0A263CV85_9PSEU|nr:oxidoreductase [Amycolatopsis antarctica]OZM70030.1 protochlorophyllide oxidoreductase [Amycolatopsis antarctica]
MATGQWTEDDIGDQTGRVALITGANSGLGLRTAQVLAGKGARVLMACRSKERAEAALRQVSGDAELVTLDLGDLASVRAAAAVVRERTGDTLDLLINNAGLMAPPRGRTADGFETQFGVNHLGHAALTWLLLPALRGAAGARVVTLSSIAARGSSIVFGDPNFEHRRYNPMTAYGQSKLANQVFALELDRRLRAADEEVISVAAHPGYSHTGLASAMAKSHGNTLVRGLVGIGAAVADRVIAQDARMGTLPQLYAATEPGVSGGDYIGPRGPGGVRGHPDVTAPLPPARDARIGANLWDVTAEMTGVTPDPS